MSTRTLRLVAGLALLALSALRCAPGDAAAGRVPDADAHAADHDRGHAPDEASADAASAAAAAASPGHPPVTTEPVPEPGILHTVAAVTVQGRSGPDGRPFEIALRTRDPAGMYGRRFGTRTLMIGLRTSAPDLTQYPCTSCHLGRALAPGQERVVDAHRDIPATHPAEAGGCMTCHAATDVESLGLRSGERVSMDHAYRLCAQCHFSQADDWAAGAHGKRLDGWQGRRVVMSCTECHDPHQPVLPQRVPFRAPILNPDRSRKP